MLDLNAWRSYEPRFGFPTFRGVRTLLSCSLSPDFRPFQPLRLPRLVAGTWKRGLLDRRAVRDLAVEYATMPFSPALFQRTRFRLIIATRDGLQLATHRIPGDVPPGGSMDVDVSAVLRDLGLPDDDYLAVVVMSRGRPDFMRSSPTSFSMTYCTDCCYTTYRTGGFSRVLNEPSRRKHAGFRGINPKAVADAERLSSILLINHSSNPSYNDTVSPTSVLIRADGATRSGDFGAIPPFGGRERTLEDLFGMDVAEFLSSAGGKGTVITTCPGVTLASLHLMRSRDGRSMSLEHSRPSHAYLANGAPIG